MTSIERTAYPRFKKHISKKELEQVYTPSQAELNFISKLARKYELRLGATLLLKSFQRLGYFPAFKDIPRPIVQHISELLNFQGNPYLDYEERTLYRQHQNIRSYLDVLEYNRKGTKIIESSMTAAAQVMDNPADIINVAIEELVRQRVELPAFSTLDRMAGKIRHAVNQSFFDMVNTKLADYEKGQLEELLNVADPKQKSLLNTLKELPKRSSLQHLQRLLDHIVRLSNTVGANHHLDGIPHTKIKHFAAEARIMDVAELKDFNVAKRHVLLLSLIYRTRIKARDDLANMFIKRMNHIHQRGKDELEQLRIRHRYKTEFLVATLSNVIDTLDTYPEDAEAGRAVRQLLIEHGGLEAIQDDCAAITAYSGDNYYPLLWRFYRSHRATLFRMVHLLDLTSTSQDQSLIQAINLLLEYENRRIAIIDEKVDFSFTNERWKKTIIQGDKINRQHFEVCVFSSLASEIKSGDISIYGSETYADYREQLLNWQECEPLVANYCEQLNFPNNAQDFTTHLKDWLSTVANTIDQNYPSNGHVTIGENGVPVLKRHVSKEPTASSKELETALLQRLPERNVIDVLCDVAHWTGWTRHFGPLSGSDPKIDNPTERYILTAFTYGCNLGPAQASRHLRGTVTPHMLSFVNRRHCDVNKLNSAMEDIINHYHQFKLPKIWGEGKTAAADGTKYDMYDQNLMAEYHIRYGGYGGIAYHHVADNYVALFSHFIPCGVWEAIYIIEGLLKNKSDIQPDTVHADTQGQSAPVFALAYLLGINLMPRIRNWHDLKMFKPDKDVKYKHIDSLFKDVINWEIIETHWQDLLQVVLSIKTGKISSSMILRKLGNYSRKNRLYQAFRELGRVVRTVFLLRYISDLDLREQITATTNKVEAYNGFTKWLFFGGGGTIAENDPEEQEKIIKYNDLVANALIYHNVVDQTRILKELVNEGYLINREDIARLSPYITSHIKRFGDYIIDINVVPDPVDVEFSLEKIM